MEILKQKALRSTIKEMYTEYLKWMSVYTFLVTEYAEDLKEDVDKLRKELSEVRGKADLIDADKEPDDLRLAGIRIAELDGRIEFVEGKKEEVKKAKVSVNETIRHYNYLKKHLNSNDYKKEPEVIK